MKKVRLWRERFHLVAINEKVSEREREGREGRDICIMHNYKTCDPSAMRRKHAWWKKLKILNG